MVNKCDEVKEDNPSLAEDMELTEKLSLISSAYNTYTSDAETVGEAFRKIFKRIQESNDGKE